MAFSIAAFKSGVTIHTRRINPDVAAAKALHLVGEGWNVSIEDVAGRKYTAHEFQRTIENDR